MTKRSIPINDKEWDVTGQFAETWPVSDILRKDSFHHRQMNAKRLLDNTRMEAGSKTLDRQKVEQIDDLEASGIRLKGEAYLRSLQFHWWDRDDDAYFYWDLK